MEGRFDASETGSFPDGLFSLSNYLDPSSPIVLQQTWTDAEVPDRRTIIAAMWPPAVVLSSSCGSSLDVRGSSFAASTALP
jgi:hypothetical protein